MTLLKAREEERQKQKKLCSQYHLLPSLEWLNFWQHTISHFKAVLVFSTHLDNGYGVKHKNTHFFLGKKIKMIGVNEALGNGKSNEYG